MKLNKSAWLIVASWVLFVGGFALVSLKLGPSGARQAFGDITLCIVPLFANACLLWNASTPYRRQNNFWMLLALGCTLWLAGELFWTYKQLVLHVQPAAPMPLDIIFFLHTIPLMASLALLPHHRKMRETLRFGRLDLLLLAFWWMFLYCWMAVAWLVNGTHPVLYHLRDMQINTIADLIFVVGMGALVLQAKGSWRKVYANLFGAAATYAFGIWLIIGAVGRGAYSTGSLYDLPFVATFVWFATAGVMAHRVSEQLVPIDSPHQRDAQWPGRLAMLCVLSMPAMAAWSAFFSHAPHEVREFRLSLTLISIVIGTALIFLRQHLVDRERIRLMSGLEDSVEHLKRLQTQFVQAEKLASLGQLAAGAAHEINNPLTAILCYADLIMVDDSAGEKARGLAEKVREQARRTKVLVTNLLSFARQVPAEKQLLDLKTVLTSAIELRQLDLRDKNIRIEMDMPAVLPAVRGDPNQLLQVFYNLISNAVDSMATVGGGTLRVRTRGEQGSVMLEFSDTGPGLQEPERVFDPFYTTKPVGKGTGLGLSICYGIVQEHGGQITGFNKPDGGCTFRVVLPAVLALIPQMSPNATLSSR